MVKTRYSSPNINRYNYKEEFIEVIYKYKL